MTYLSAIISAKEHSVYKRVASWLPQSMSVRNLRMKDLEKQSGRFVAVILLGVFIWRVTLSGHLLLDEKIASSQSKQYSRWRLFPSLTICMGLKNVHYKDLLQNIDANLQRLKDEVVVSLKHKNITESGWERHRSWSPWSTERTNFREVELINKTALIGHVGVPLTKPNLCITYQLIGPTIKSHYGVRC